LKSCFSKQRISSHKRKIGYVSWLVSTTTNTAFTYSYTVLCELCWGHRKKSHVSATNASPVNCCDSPYVAYHSCDHSDYMNVAMRGALAQLLEGNTNGKPEPQSATPYLGLLFHGLSTVNAIYLWSENYQNLGYAFSFLPSWTKCRYVSTSAMF
jgi:hypothetical protein